MLSDFRFALRTLAKSPAFSIAAIVCLTLGIGVNATIFSLRSRPASAAVPVSGA
jgi:putative ABC transport system permease protein